MEYVIRFKSEDKHLEDLICFITPSEGIEVRNGGLQKEPKTDVELALQFTPPIVTTIAVKMKFSLAPKYEIDQCKDLAITPTHIPPVWHIKIPFADVSEPGQKRRKLIFRVTAQHNNSYNSEEILIGAIKGAPKGKREVFNKQLSSLISEKTVLIEEVAALKQKLRTLSPEQSDEEKNATQGWVKPNASAEYYDFFSVLQAFVCSACHTETISLCCMPCWRKAQAMRTDSNNNNMEY